MSVIAAALKHMLSSGMDHDAIVSAVADMEAAMPKDEQAERRRAADRERKRLRKSAEAAEGADQVSPKKETSPTPPKEKTTPSQSETNVSSKNPRAALRLVLDDERAGAVIEHRQRIRKPLTTRAAELLAGKFAKCPDPNAAADTMLGNGWQGFEPEWLERSQARGSPRQPQPKYDPFKALAEDLDDGQDRSQRSNHSNWDDAQGVPFLTIEHH